MRFKGSVQYTANTIRLINRVIPSVFPYLSRYLTIIVCFALIFVGNHVGYDTTRGQFAGLLGVMLIPFNLYIEHRNVEKEIERRGATVRRVTYYFKDDAINCSEPNNSTDLPYDAFCVLAEDSAFYYLFLARRYVILVGTNTLSPKKAEEFKAFLTAKTGLPWLKVTPFCFVNRALFYRRKKTA